jgi:hypothetical protein
MATKYLRDKTGFIYDWNPILAKNPDCEEVTEQEAYPENFIPKKQANRKTGLALETENIPEAPTGNEELNQEASKGL